MSRISVNLSDGLRHHLEEAREKSGRSLTAEVEARLRDSLNARGSNNLLLLRFDDGLWAWLNAHVTGIGIVGGLEETAIYMIRSAIIKDHQSDVFLRMMFPHLPASIQDALRGLPAIADRVEAVRG